MTNVLKLAARSRSRFSLRNFPRRVHSVQMEALKLNRSFLDECKGKKGVKSPAKSAKKCMKSCKKDSTCMGGEWLQNMTGKGKNKVKTRSCILYSDAPIASGIKPEEKKNKAVCFYPSRGMKENHYESTEYELWLPRINHTETRTKICYFTVTRRWLRLCVRVHLQWILCSMCIVRSSRFGSAADNT